MEKSIEIEEAIITIVADGVMHVHLKVEHRFDLHHADNIYEARLKLAKGGKFAIMYTAPKFIRPTRAVRKHLASDERLLTTTADAFVINSIAHRLMANMYIRINKPKLPTAIFEDKQEAIEWLKNFAVPKD